MYSLDEEARVLEVYWFKGAGFGVLGFRGLFRIPLRVPFRALSGIYKGLRGLLTLGIIGISVYGV